MTHLKQYQISTDPEESLNRSSNFSYEALLLKEEVSIEEILDLILKYKMLSKR